MGIRHIGSVVEAEIRAIQFGLLLAVQRDLRGVRVYSDSAVAVQEVASPSESINNIGSLVLNVLDILESGRFMGIAHVNRCTNMVAHYLAHFALSHPSLLCWADGLCPSC